MIQTLLVLLFIGGFITLAIKISKSKKPTTDSSVVGQPIDSDPVMEKPVEVDPPTTV